MTTVGRRCRGRRDYHGHAIVGGIIEAGRVFDVTTDLDGVPASYQDMADRKVLINP
ncbi:hypothetical protein [Streptomyces soliscabiei]|uniref:hypothetical protein n=1 Tax=Streptomyces soliscabiei TaxID=588897 RepID=UPI0029BB219B|nr:hypothetical protein [Streptomyces sp. NY05-11A]MDX2682135.1 hypothetical protein [Streptomyces sp. NY05-11A]